MTQKLRYEQLGFRFEFPVPLEKAPGAYADSFLGIDKYTAHDGLFRREQDIYYALEMVAFWHFQVPGAQPPDIWLQRGVDCALHYFLDDWICKDDPEEFNLGRAKQHREEEIPWYESFSRGLVLALLSNRWESVDQLCSWVWADLIPEYSGMGSDLEDELAQIYIIVAAHLRSEPMEGLERLVAKVRACRRKRPKLLLKSWDPVVARDQDAFDKAIKDSLQHHARQKWDSCNAKIADRLALPQTAICLTAMHYGMAFPDVPGELGGYLITRESLGLL